MQTKRKFAQRLIGTLAVAVAAGGVYVAAPAFQGTAAAQVIFDDRYPFFNRRWFAPRRIEEERTDFSRAPAPARKPPDAPPPTTTILVLGDSMADWLAYGLEDAFSESPEIGIVRKHRTFSGLLRYENRPDAPEWPQVAREHIAAEKPNFIVMMIGIQDRQPIRETVKEKPARGQQQGAKRPGEQTQSDDDDPEQPNIVAPERTRPGIVEYRSERWEELYIRKIDDVIAALKSRNVPIYWIGLPALRGTKSTSDMLYLNELYRARAERAGITFVDVWDGFIDDNGKFATFGPDLEGQNRRLRTSDGVHFTKFGARKLAHYAERELRRGLLSPTPVALPMPDPAPQPAKPKPGVVMPRPLAGPQIPLLAKAKGNEELDGARPVAAAKADPVATSVLTKGEAVRAPAGRADDFTWPRRGVAPVGTDPVATLTSVPTQSAKHQEEMARAAAEAEAREKAEAQAQREAQQAAAVPPPGPPQPQRPRWVPRGWERPFWSLFNTLR
jgi:hypothetical protein